MNLLFNSGMFQDLPLRLLSSKFILTLQSLTLTPYNNVKSGELSKSTGSMLINGIVVSAGL